MKNRKIYLKALLLEAVRILKEQDPAGTAVPPSPVPPAPATNTTATTTAPATPNPGVAPPADGNQPKPFDVDQMIERLNVIRGGKSFADPEVYGQLTTYFKGLSDADKAAIERFLQSINKIVIQVDTTTQDNQSGGAQPPMNQSQPAPVSAAPPPTATPGGM